MNNSVKILLSISIGVLAALFLAEIGSQVLFALMVEKGLKARQAQPLHYYEASDDPVLRYALKAGYQIERDGRRLVINDHGIRDYDNQTVFPRSVALLGDSVAFGISLDQEATPAAALQRLAGDGIRILNFGTPGYALEEIVRFLELKFPVYKPGTIYYVLNLNDFSRRDSVYEGGDDGLYRTYNKPFLKLPFFIRKATYRYFKEGKMSSIGWYRWMYEGNRDRLLPIVLRMDSYVKSNGGDFKVVLFPPAVAYEGSGFSLQDIFDEITDYLRKHDIPVLSPVADFGLNVYELQDQTDHFTDKGSEAIARVLWEDLSE